MTYELAIQLFEYKNGILYWRENTGHNYSGKEVSPSKSNRYIQFKYKRRVYYLHRVIFLIHYGYLPKYVDHINQNKHDNRIENLRACTMSENMSNTKGWSNRNLPKGISKNGRNYIARIKYRGVQYRLGTYKTIEEAEKKYIEKSKELQKEFSPYISFA